MGNATHAVPVRSAPGQAEAALREVLDGKRGGQNRRRILRTLDERPRNANRLASALKLDYKTIRHHLSVLEEADAVTCAGDGYGTVYVLTPRTRQHWNVVRAAGDDAD